MAGNADHAIDFGAGMLMTPTSAADWLIVAPSLITIVGGASLVMLRYQTKWHGYLACLYLAALVVINAILLSRVMEGGPLTMTMGRWLPPFGITLVVDALGALMALISAIVALAVCIYSLADISVTSRRFGFYPSLLWMMAGITGSFLTGDIFNLYVWFEVMLISSFGLLIVDGERIQMDGAMKYAVLNLMATTLFLVTTGYLYGAVGTLNMADIAMRLREMPQGAAPMGTIATLYLLAFSMKAAAFPVNFWLPASYHTPKIVVSAIFAGLLTKVGVYALIRTLVMVMPEGRDLLSDLIAWIAAFTMIVGALGALAQNDVRRSFGFLVVGGIGSSMVGVAVGTESAITGAILYAVNSILVMTALYLAFGILMRKNGGKYNLAELGGGYRASSWLSILFLALVFAASGLPPFSGFWPKMVLVESSLKEGYGWLAFALLLSGFITTIAMGRIWAHAFWRGGPIGTQDGRDGAPLHQLSEIVRQRVFVPVAALVALIVYIGINPAPVYSVSQYGAATLLQPDEYFDAVFGPVREQEEARAAEKAGHQTNTGSAETPHAAEKPEGAH
ncbi:Na+/H+ antiporter subunit D [uncultured Cohaesibacter sp.]|uniref:Na+/H+ antiporter subunit D n=1 Tax=uncultured Cohaesibacter sp. TaxID=1002546 RepID=UPI0029C86923|nr:Na+/H+ antiporter subunit D [uncultured Cohaesibacter sp.]